MLKGFITLVVTTGILLAGSGYGEWISGGRGWKYSNADTNFYPWSTACKIGIGTTSPSFKLDVNGSIRLTGDIPYIADTRGLFLGYAGSTNTAKIHSMYQGASYDPMDIRAKGLTLAATHDSNITFQTGSTHETTTKVIIDKDGNVGIGTTSPKAKLHVESGGVIDKARYDLLDKLVTINTSGCGKVMVTNGQALTINGGSSWLSYSNVPDFLLGALSTSDINTSDSFSVTLACTMTVFLFRNDGWNGVSTSGWTSLGSYSFNPGGSGSTLYVKTLAAGTHTLDNNSAMYIFMIW